MQDTFKEHTQKTERAQAIVAALEKAGLAEYERVYQAAWDRAPFF